MLNISFDIALILGVIGFYLADSVRLIYRNELILSVKSGQWHSTVLDSGWLVGGRFLYLPNPFSPHIPLFRLTWLNKHVLLADSRKIEQSSEYLKRIMQRLKPLQWMLIILWLLLVLGLPSILLLQGMKSEFLLLTIAIYSNILLMLFWLGWHRTNLNLTNVQFIKMAFDSLICPPFALNLLRKISLSMVIKENALLMHAALASSQSLDELLLQIEKELSLMLDGTTDHLREQFIANHQMTLEQIKHHDKYH